MAAKILVVEQVYYQDDGCQPSSIEAGYARVIGGHEQPFTRVMRVGQEPVPLECGWLTTCSVLVIWNKGPSDIEVSLGGFVALLGPTESLRIRPESLNRILLRSRGDMCRVDVYMYPE